jgi:hypothetical protein
MRVFMKKLFAFIVFGLCFGFGVWMYSDYTNKQAEKALKDFYNYQGFKDKATTPLYQGGEKVIPLVIENVKDKNMTRRLDAIAFLGKPKNYQAMPVLTLITKDETEDIHSRKQALWAIYQIDVKVALDLAYKYKDRQDYLGEYATCIALGKSFCP